MNTRFSRRTFLSSTAAASGALLATRWSSLGAGAEAESKNGIPYRLLGKTGVAVSCIGIGGSHMGKAKTAQESIEIVRKAIDSGINFMDNSWDYNGGASEERMGQALRDGYREKAFLMTKIDGRDAKTAASQINESLKRLQTDHVDLMQFHEIIRMDDPDRIFAKGGALEAMLDAQKAGKVRFIGYTGHKSPEIHLHMLQVADEHHFTFDTVQMPLNVMDAKYDSFQTKMLPVAVERGMGILGMKPIGSGELLKSKTVSAEECLRFAMSLPVSVTITGCDSVQILDQAIAIARGFKGLNESEMQVLVAKAGPAASTGEYELYKTTHHFDSTYQNPQWLG